MDESRLEQLFERYINQTANPQEEREFFELAELPGNKERLQILLDQFIKDTIGENNLSPVAEEAILHAIVQARPKVVPMRKPRVWPRIAIAAALMGLLAVGIWFFTQDRTGLERETVTVRQNDVEAPKVAKAMITLADGRTVALDSVSGGMLAMQGGVKVVKLSDGQIVYEGSLTTDHSPLTFNTLTNPRGSKVIDITLSDGSRVWLNAESSLKYPVAFVGEERRVEVTGEAYFEVSTKYEIRSTKKKPFVVEANGVVTEVLGTHFNVNAYDDEEATRVTLLEGSVRVSQKEQAVIIKPGEQVTITRNQKPETRNNIDLDAVMAWKNGFFSFNNADLAMVMRQLARWYDLEVRYVGAVPPGKFKGEISKDLTLSQILTGLNLTRINYKLEGKKITIL